MKPKSAVEFAAWGVFGCLFLFPILLAQLRPAPAPAAELGIPEEALAFTAGQEIEYIALHIEDFADAIAEKGVAAAPSTRHGRPAVDIQDADGATYRFSSNGGGEIHCLRHYPNGDAVQVTIAVSADEVDVDVNGIDTVITGHVAFSRPDYAPVPNHSWHDSDGSRSAGRVSLFLPEEDLRRLVRLHDAIQTDLIDVFYEHWEDAGGPAEALW